MTVEIEAPATGVLRDVTAQPGDVVPVGQTIALIFAAGEAAHAPPRAGDCVVPSGREGARRPGAPRRRAAPYTRRREASPLARRVAEQHGVDLAAIKTASGRIEKADVLAYVERTKAGNGSAAPRHRRRVAEGAAAGRRARRRPARRARLGPGGAVLAADVPAPAAPAARRDGRRRRAWPRRPASATSGASWPSA